MLLGSDRDQYRNFYREAWRKRKTEAPMEPLEMLVADVVAEHPEYHKALEGPIDQEFGGQDGEANPFLHMGLHISIREQLATNRPAGLRELYLKLAQRLGSTHEAEHRVMGCLTEALWAAGQGDAAAFDEHSYLECIRRNATKR